MHGRRGAASIAVLAKTDRVVDLTREELTTLIRQIVRDELQAAPRSYRIGQATPENWQAVLASFIPTPSPELALVRLLLEEREQWRKPLS